MTWTRRTSSIRVGDTVRYSASFLRSIACYTGPLPQARGTVLALHVLSPDVTLAEVDWDRDDVPLKVNVRNVQRVNERGQSHD